MTTSPTKAILAAVAAALSSFIASVQGRPEIETLHAVDWVLIVASALLAGLLVYTVPNRPTNR